MLRKLDKGQMVMKFRETDMIGFVKEIMAYFEQLAKTKSITLTLSCDAEQILVWVDRKNFDKVLMNILSNAFKYTPAGGKVAVSVTHDEHECVIAVYDNGEKIPEDKIDKIFQRFFQVSSVANDNHAGTGIGLDLARALVEQHSGTISARNEEERCTFTVIIPMGNAHINKEQIETSALASETSALAEFSLSEMSDNESFAMVSPLLRRHFLRLSLRMMMMRYAIISMRIFPPTITS